MITESDRIWITKLIANLKKQCNLHVNGACTTLACLMQGGYKRGQVPVDCSIATCDQNEQIKALESIPSIAELVNLYNTAYTAGHNDTVEGVYTHVLACDFSTYHTDEVIEWLEEYKNAPNQT